MEKHPIQVLMRTLAVIAVFLLSVPVLADEDLQQRASQATDPNGWGERIERTLGQPMQEFPDGINVSGELKGGVAGWLRQDVMRKLYSQLQESCRKLGDAQDSAFTLNLRERWSEFFPKDRDVGKLAQYLVSLNVVREANALRAARAISYSGGGALVGFSAQTIEDALVEHRGTKPYRASADLQPFLCVARRNGYERTIAFSAGFFGTNGKSDLYFFYIPESYFRKANEENLHYHGSAEFLDKGEDASRYYSKRAQEVIGYRYESNTSPIRAVQLKMAPLLGSLTISFANAGAKPIVFGMQSINSVEVGDAEYALIYRTINGRLPLAMTTDNMSCPMLNGDKEVLINPRSKCGVTVSPIEIPGIQLNNLPNVDIRLKINGQVIVLKPILRGDT